MSEHKEKDRRDKDKDRSRRKRRPSNPEHERAEGAYTVVVRNQSLVLAYRRLALASLMSIIAAVTCLLVLVLVAGRPVPPQYIPITTDGRLLPLIPLNKPNVNDGVVGEFALQTIREVNNYDYLNWRTQLPRAQQRFVPDAWKSYMQEFEATNIIRTVQDRKMIVSATASGNVEMVNQGIVKGVYIWRVEVPISIQYTAHSEGNQATGSLASEGVVTLYIQRVPLTVSDTGLAVRSYQYEQKMR